MRDAKASANPTSAPTKSSMMVSTRYVWRATVLCGVIGALASWSCTPRPRVTPIDWSEGECYRHDQCRQGAACVEARCVSGRLNEPANVDQIFAQQWFESRDGRCVYDSSCGPWVCREGSCQAPGSVGVTLPARETFAYWDLSCVEPADCGTWVCANGWCHSGDAVDSRAERAHVRLDGRTTRTCLADTDCGGDTCVYPGFCYVGVGHLPMTFADIQDLGYGLRADGTCDYDDDCGPRICYENRCVPAEHTPIDPRLRRDYSYYDGSCNQPSDCHGWDCVRGWCRDPERVNPHRSQNWYDDEDEFYAYRALLDVDSYDIAQLFDEDTYAWPCGSNDDTACHEIGGLLLGPDDDASMFGTLDLWSIDDTSWLDQLAEGVDSNELGGLGAMTGSYDPDIGASIEGGGVGSVSGYDVDAGTGDETEPNEAIASRSTRSFCQSHATCAGACIWPGSCASVDEAARVALPVAQLIDAYVLNEGASCGASRDCDLAACDGGLCVVPNEVPLASTFTYLDGSCLTDAHCGLWACNGTFCYPP